MTQSSTDPHLELAANISMLFGELNYFERFTAAATAGFQSAESWWPFAAAVPERSDVDALLAAVDRSGTPLSALNLFAGDMLAGERGVVCRLDRRGEFEANLDVVMHIASSTGCRGFNALYGQRVVGQPPAEQDDLAIHNLTMAARRLADIGGTVFIEPLTRGSNGEYPLETATQAAYIVERVRERSGLDNIGLLFDTFHLANNGEDLALTVDRFAQIIAHVQIADAPGRGEPGSGHLPIPELIARLWDAGYRKVVACEYRPSGSTTLESLASVDSIPHVRLHPR